MKIGILQTGHTHVDMIDEHGDLKDLFEKLLSGQGFEFVTFSVVDMEFPSSVNDADGWLITGSKHGAYEDHDFIAPLETLIRDIYAAEVPLVGICFGHQIIAQALGGQVEKFHGGWAVGRQSYDWNGEEVSLNAWHQDQVTKRPADAELCASNEFCENAALIYGKKAFTMQAHPEFGAQFIDEMIQNRGKGVVPDPLLAGAEQALKLPIGDQDMAQRIGDFFRAAKS